MRQVLPVSAILLLLVGACASYNPSSPPVPQAAEAKGDDRGGLAVRIDPYVDPKRQKSVFDADFGKAGVLALQVAVDNRTGRTVVVRRSDMILTLPGGGQISPASAMSAATKVGESGSVVGAAFMFGIVGLLAAASAEDTARAARRADYESKEFRDERLLKDQSGHGFVYFIPPPGTPSFDTATLVVRFMDADAVTSRVVRVSLPGLAFPGASERPGRRADCGSGFQTGPACR